MYTFYGIGELFLNSVSLLYTKFFWHGARLVRLPIFARGKKNIHYKHGFTTGYQCRISVSNKGSISFGENVVMGDNIQIQCEKEITFGDNVLLASRIYIGDTSHGRYSGPNQTDPNIPPNERELVSDEIHIGNNVWIGNQVSILGGCNIGDGCIIGANSVVTHDLEANSIYAGSPARLIKRWDDSKEQWITVL